MPAKVATHITIDKEGVAWIDGTNVKAIEVVLDKRAYGWSPEEIRANHPDLSLAQIYAVFAYYYENKEAVDAEIERRRHDAEALKGTLPKPAFTRKQLESRRGKLLQPKKRQ